MGPARPTTTITTLVAYDLERRERHDGSVAFIVCDTHPRRMTDMNRRRTLLASGLLAALVLVGCGSSDDSSSSTSTTTADDGGDPCATLPLKHDGVLTVATGEEVYPPWVEG